jgi:hypothetical protein
MKHKLLTVLLISVFVVSLFGVAFAAVCPRCHGTGKISEQEPCPTCQGSATSQATIEKTGTHPGATTSSSGGPATAILGVFHNNGDAGVYGTVTAQVKVSQTESYQNTSASTYFPPGEDVSVTVIIDGIKYQPYYSCSINFDGASSVNCPTCGGTGYVIVTKTCPDCGGTGVVSGFGDNLNLEGPGGVVVGVVVVGAVVAVGFIVVRKRRVTEQSLRRLSSYEFQDWVIKKVYANPSSQKDSYLGIDAYTAEGYPVQIRQDNDVGKRAIDSFAAAMARNKARTGTIVAFGFGNDAPEGVMKARLNYRLEIKTVTVKELLANKGRTF